MADEGAAPELTQDTFFGGKLKILQPRKGHRSGTDAVLLAAAVPRDASGLVVDVGAGVGVAGLGVAAACPGTRVCLLEKDPALAALARVNIVDNDFDTRAEVVTRDLFDRAPASGQAQLVISNPPFYESHAIRPSADVGRRSARVMGERASLRGWIDACLDLLDAKGTLILLHLPSALADMLGALDGRAGGITILAVHPRAGVAAKRLLLRAVKGSRAPLSIAASLVLHEGEGFTDAARELHEGEAALAW